MYEPKPLNTDDVNLPEDLLALTEKIAKNVHDVWACGRIAEGWTYGPKKDVDKKETPQLVPYEELPESEKEYDRNTALETLKLISMMGYTISSEIYTICLKMDCSDNIFRFDKRKIIVGRDAECDVRFADMTVSRRHLEIICNGDLTYTVVDLNSANGTYIKDVGCDSFDRITANDAATRVIHEGAYIRVGGSAIIQVLHSGEQSPTCFANMPCYSQPAIPQRMEYANSGVWKSENISVNQLKGTAVKPSFSQCVPNMPIAPFASVPTSDIATSEKTMELRKVEFSAVAPKYLRKGDYTILHVVMYEKAFRDIVEELKNEMEGSVQETRSGVREVSRNSMVRVNLTSPDIAIEDNEMVLEWQGDYLDFAFSVLLPEGYRKRQVLFEASVYVNDVIATRLKFIVARSSIFNSVFRPRFKQKIFVERKDVLSAFVSYASQDRDRVAAIIQGMKKARPDMDIFFDVTSLRSGENWEQTLRKEIDARDVLFLCWSLQASMSEWVDKEWRYALKQKGKECIEPIPMEQPDICPPPKELAGKHFNDELLYIINAKKN